MNISVAKYGRETWKKRVFFKLLPLQFRRWEWVYWIMDLFIGLEKKEKQQSWYQSGLKPLDLWGFSAIAGGCLNLPFISLGLIKTRPFVASFFHMQNVTFASSQLDLLKLDWSKNLQGRLRASVCKYLWWEEGCSAGIWRHTCSRCSACMGFKSPLSLQKTHTCIHTVAGSVHWSIC